jgi:long-chain fatty acid transport protein
MMAGLAGAANAGGLEASGYNWDLLFDPAPYAARANGTFVRVDQDVRSDATGNVVSTTPDQWRYLAGVKGSITDDARCLVTATNPWGTGVERTDEGALLNPFGPRAFSETLTSLDAGLTCAYGFEVGSGTLSAIGGISYQSLRYEAALPTLGAPTIPSTLDLDGSGIGWRAGVAYEIPEIALRATAIYTSAIDYELDGTLTTPIGAAASSAEATVPQTFEVKAQTGVAPGWLVLGGIKWVDWSVLQNIDLNLGGNPSQRPFLYRDGVTVTLGGAHVLNEQVTLSAALVYDRGTSATDDNGVLLTGTQTDRYGINAGVIFAPTEGLEITGGVSFSQLMAGSNRQDESWDRSNVFGASLAVKGSF